MKPARSAKESALQATRYLVVAECELTLLSTLSSEGARSEMSDVILVVAGHTALSTAVQQGKLVSCDGCLRAPKLCDKGDMSACVRAYVGNRQLI